MAHQAFEAVGVVGDVFWGPDALAAGLGEDGGDAGFGGGGDGRAGADAGDEVGDAEGLGHVERGCVDLLVAGAEEDGEG